VILNIAAAPINRTYDVLITDGLVNPRLGPYSYGGFIIDIQNIRGFSIDGA
jgi:hypothetical protein